MFKKYGPCNIGGQGLAALQSDARGVAQTAKGGSASRKKLRQDKQDGKVQKKARTALQTLSGTSSSNMSRVSMDAKDAKDIMEKDVEVRRQAEARMRFEARSEALREALKLCEGVQDAGMIREATMQLIAHLQSNPDAQKSAASSSPDAQKSAASSSPSNASPCIASSSHMATMPSSTSTSPATAQS